MAFFKARSVGFSDDGETASLSTVTESGENLIVSYAPAHWALILEDAAKYVSRSFRQERPSRGRPKEVPFSDDVKPG